MRGFYFKCSQEQKELWEEAAKAAGLSLSTWIKDKLDEAMALGPKASNEAEPVPNGTPSPRWLCKCGQWNNFRSECTKCGRSRKFAVEEKT